MVEWGVEMTANIKNTKVKKYLLAKKKSAANSFGHNNSGEGKVKHRSLSALVFQENIHS